MWHRIVSPKARDLQASVWLVLSHSGSLSLSLSLYIYLSLYLSIYLSISLPLYLSTSSVHLRVEEKITLTCGRDGGLQNMEILGMVTLRVTDDKGGRIRIVLNNNDKKGVQLQVSTPLTATKTKSSGKDIIKII